MKKLLTTILILSITLTLSGCSKPEDEELPRYDIPRESSIILNELP